MVLLLSETLGQIIGLWGWHVVEIKSLCQHNGFLGKEHDILSLRRHKNGNQR